MCGGALGCQAITNPPLTSTTAPVMKLAWSEHRKATTSAISCGLPYRPRGILSRRSSISLIIWVSTSAGAMAFERIPRREYSRARDFASVRTPAFEAEYAAEATPPPVLPALDETRTMRPDSAASMFGTRGAHRETPR